MNVYKTVMSTVCSSSQGLRTVALLAENVVIMVHNIFWSHKGY